MRQGDKRRTYVCKRARMASFLRDRGFNPYKIAPDRDNPMYEVFLFTASSELYNAVMEYIDGRKEPDVQVAVEVQGGLVRNVYANSNVSVEVCDLDVSEFDDDEEAQDEADKRAAELNELVKSPGWSRVW